MECQCMPADYLFVVILMMFCSTEAYHAVAQNDTHQPTKLVKTKNIDVQLTCSLLDKHEKFNQNTSVTWWFRKTCKVSCWNQEDELDWTEIECNGPCKATLHLNDENASNGFYLCRMFPYKVSEKMVLQIEVMKTYLLEIIDPMMLPPPELLNDSTNQFNVKLPFNSQLVLQCKCRSSQKPTIKWFKKKDDAYLSSDGHTFESYKTFVESSRSIKYFENFYEPMTSPGLKDLGDNLYLSKLIVNNITQNSIYVCVAINYFGFGFRENYVNVRSDDDGSSDDVAESVMSFPEKKFEILLLIPVVLLMPISVLICTILYLLIHRQILKHNKNVEIV